MLDLSDPFSMSGLPNVSIVMPCCNVPYVAATLRSVIAHGEAHIWVILVDDGSAEGVPEVIDRRFPQVRRIIRQTKHGVAAARNGGIEESRPDWVAFEDSGDLWLPGQLEALFERLAGTPARNIVYGHWAVWPSGHAGPSTQWLADLRHQVGEPGLWIGPSGPINPELLLACPVWRPGALAQRSLLTAFDGTDAAVRIGEDMTCRCARHAHRARAVAAGDLPCAPLQHQPACA